jgi:hypothetical protein
MHNSSNDPASVKSAGKAGAPQAPFTAQTMNGQGNVTDEPQHEDNTYICHCWEIRYLSVMFM